MLVLDPIEDDGKREHGGEAACGLLVASGDGAPFFQPPPQPLDAVAVLVDPWWSSDRRFVPQRRDYRTGARPTQMRSRKAWLV